MTRAEALHKLAALRPWLQERGVTRVRLFGSVARDEAAPGSDVDLIVDLEKPLGLAFFALERDLAERLGATVDLVTEAGLAPDVRYTALQDALDA